VKSPSGSYQAALDEPDATAGAPLEELPQEGSQFPELASCFTSSLAMLLRSRSSADAVDKTTETVRRAAVALAERDARV
jgi:hypothetical protein